MMMISWIFLILLMLYWVSDPGQPALPVKDALDVLRERYARGEIEFEEFDERQRVLQK